MSEQGRQSATCEQQHNSSSANARAVHQFQTTSLFHQAWSPIQIFQKLCQVYIQDLTSFSFEVCIDTYILKRAKPRPAIALKRPPKKTTTCWKTKWRIVKTMRRSLRLGDSPQIWCSFWLVSFFRCHPLIGGIGVIITWCLNSFKSGRTSCGSMFSYNILFLFYFFQ